MVIRDSMSQTDQAQALLDQLTREMADLPGEQKERVEAILDQLRACLSTRPAPDDQQVNLYGEDIAERKRVEEALAASERRYREIIQYAPSGIYEVDFRSGKFTSVNDSMVELSGYSREELLQMRAMDLLDEEGQALFQERIRQWLAGEKPSKGVEYRVKAKDGHIIYAVLNSTFTRDELGRPLGATVIGHDITERKRAEEALRKSEEKFARAFHATTDALAIIRLQDGMYIDCNESFLKLVGYAREEIIGHTSIELGILRPVDREAMIRHWQGHASILNYEYQFHSKMGEIRDAVVSIEPIEIDGEPCCLTTLVDITVRKLTEAFKKAGLEIDQAVHSTLNFKEVLDRSIAIAATALGCDTAGLSLRKEDHWQVESVYGLPAAMVGMEMDDEQERHAVLAIQTRQPVPVNDAFNDERFNREHLRKYDIRSVLVMPVTVKNEAIGVVFFNYQKSTFEFQQVHVDFAAQVASSLSSALENAQLYQSLEKEIAERKAVEAQLLKSNEALRKSEEKFVRAFHSSPVALAITRVSDGRLVDVNESYFQISGYTHAEIIGRTGIELGLYANPDEQAELDALLRERGRVRNYEMTARKKDGEAITVLFSIEPFELDGEACILSTMIDISERKQAEQARLESEAAQRISAANERARANEIEALMDAAPAVIWISRDPECREMTGNRYSYDFLNIRQGENVSKTAPEKDLGVQQYHMEIDGRPVDAGELPMQIAAVTGKPTKDYAFDLVYADGTSYQMFGNVNPLLDLDGKPYGAIGVFVDLTNLRRLEVEQVMAKAEIEVQRRLMDQREQERMAIARDLHDGPIQTLSGSVFHLQVIKEIFPDQALHVELNQIGTDIKNSIHEIREVLNDLRPPALMHFGFTRMIQMYTQDLRERFTEIEIEMNVMDDNRVLSDQAILALYRIYQAGINNIVRHSGASKAWVTYRLEQDTFYLELCDNGRGFDLAQDFTQLTRAGHFGLVGMKERAEAIGGSFSVWSEPGKGTKIVVKGPLLGKNLRHGNSPTLRE